MIKKVLKIFGILVVSGFAIGVVWYFQALKIDGDPLLTACWGVYIYDDVTGDKVVGAEDLDFDPITDTVFLSAYDRRAVDSELVAGGPVTTQGGIYTFNISDITKSDTLNVTDISRAFKEAGNEFRPHGIDLSWYPLDRVRRTERNSHKNRKGPYVGAINRRYTFQNDKVTLKPTIEFFEFEIIGSTFSHKGDLIDVNLCDPNNLTYDQGNILVTDISGKCMQGVGSNAGEVKFLSENGFAPLPFFKELSFPNGITTWIRSKYAVSSSQNYSIQIYDDWPDKEEDSLKVISLPIAPDNLTVDVNNNLYVAGFPNLLDYYFYMSELFGVKKSPSAAYRISPDDYAQGLLFKDDGTMISGATVAQRAGDFLILGSGWDDNIAICSGMDRIS